MFRKKGTKEDVSLQQVFDELQEIKGQQKEIIELLRGLKLSGVPVSAGAAAAPSVPRPLAPAAALAGAVNKNATTSSKFFISYCWANSRDAEMKKEIPKAIGETDPRAVHQLLASSGLNGW
jgi:hypothetical protein